MTTTTNLLSAQQVADMMGYEVHWVWNKVKAGEIPHFRLSPKNIRFDPVEIEAWLAKKHQAVQQPTPF
jgi:predicted DNA-binding transcriptional regulator AlpA